MYLNSISILFLLEFLFSKPFSEEQLFKPMLCLAGHKFVIIDKAKTNFFQISIKSCNSIPLYLILATEAGGMK